MESVMINTEHDPGTPDREVSPMRLRGRRAYREDNKCDCPTLGTPDRQDWWMGWYDEQLKRFFKRKPPIDLKERKNGRRRTVERD